MSLKHGQYDPKPSRGSSFMDGCHRYGWIISPILSAMISLAMFSYFVGGLNSNIESLQKDVLLLKQEVFTLAQIGRSDPNPAPKTPDNNKH